MSKLFRRATASKLGSSSFSIGTASAFVLATAALSLVADKPAPSAAIGGGWILRGAITPVDGPSKAAPAHAATQKVPNLG